MMISTHKWTFLMFFVIFIGSIVSSSAAAENITIKAISSTNFTGLPGKNFTGSFSVVSNHSEERTVMINITGLSSLHASVSPNLFSLDPYQSFTITFRIGTDGDDEGIHSGTFKMSSGSLKDSFDMLVDLFIPGNFTIFNLSDVNILTKEVSSKEVYNDFYAGRLVNMEMLVKSLYGGSDDPDLNYFNINVTVINMTEKGTHNVYFTFDQNFTIAPKGKQKLYSYDFRIPYDVEDQEDYRFVIKGEAKDIFRRNQYIEINGSIHTKRKQSEAGFRNIQILNKSVACAENLSLRIDFANTGKTKFKEGYFSAELKGLGVRYHSNLYELEPKTNVTEVVNLLVPSDAKAESQEVIVKAYDGRGNVVSESHSFETLSCANLTSSNNQTGSLTKNDSQVSNTTSLSSLNSQDLNASRNETALDSVVLNQKFSALNIVFIILIIALMIVIVILLRKYLYDETY